MHQPLRLAALPVCLLGDDEMRELRAWVSNPAPRAYETRSGTGPPAVAEGRLELPRPGRARASEARASAIPPPGDLRTE